MTDTAPVSGEQPEDRSGLVDAQLADQLLARAEAQGVELLGPAGLLSQVTKAVLERALGEEPTSTSATTSTMRPVAGRGTRVTRRRRSGC